MNESKQPKYVRIHVTFTDGEEGYPIIVPLQIGQHYDTYVRTAFENGLLFTDNWFTAEDVDGILYAIPIASIKTITCMVVNNE